VRSSISLSLLHFLAYKETSYLNIISSETSNFPFLKQINPELLIAKKKPNKPRVWWVFKCSNMIRRALNAWQFPPHPREKFAHFVLPLCGKLTLHPTIAKIIW
ncbi:hypothetical protein, partial [Salmonella sp. s51884]|uniref:hypothetical protein n=1 Tax=Salmonella sp. s51884 TaxID=3159654 RepID=UPI003980CC4C